MQLFFAGAESTSHLALLKECGVTRLGVNVSNLTRFTKNYRGWATRSRLEGLDWVAYADSPNVPFDAVLELLDGAEVIPEYVTGPVAWSEQSWLKDSDQAFLPIWDGADVTALRYYSETFDGMVLPDSVVDNPVAVRTAKASLSKMGVLGGLTGRSKGLERFDLLISSAWWAVQKHGETQVWSGNRLVRLNSEDKHLKRQRYSESIEALGCDVSAVLADDPTETVRLAVRSWLALEHHINSGHRLQATPEVARHPVVIPPTNVTPISGVVTTPPVTRHQTSASNHLVLPIMVETTTVKTVTDADGNETDESVTLMESAPQSMRQCHTCSLSAACPQYQPGSACSYKIPVTIRTKDQLHAVLNSLVEIQTQRILMGSFSEQVNGAADVLVGVEMDRLFNMVQKFKAIQEQRDTLRINVEANTGDGAAAGMGVLSRLFGAKTGENARTLEHTVLSEDVIDDIEIIGEGSPGWTPE